MGLDFLKVEHFELRELVDHVLAVELALRHRVPTQRQRIQFRKAHQAVDLRELRDLVACEN